MSDERYAEYLEGGTRDDTLDEGALAELDELRSLLAKPHVWGDPPPALADDIVAQIRAAGPGLDTSSRPDLHEPDETRGSNAPVASPRSPEGPSQRARDRRWLRPALAVAAVVAVVAVGAVLVTGGEDGGGESFALDATDVIPGAAGDATVEETGSGLSISLSVDGLPPAETGTFYQAWMRGETGSVPIGTFHAREGDGPIELWSGVDVADYPTMTVTIQQEGAGPESSGIVVLRGDIPQP